MPKHYSIHRPRWRSCFEGTYRKQTLQELFDNGIVGIFDFSISSDKALSALEKESYPGLFTGPVATSVWVRRRESSDERITSQDYRSARWNEPLEWI
jgi:hypothetical protein